MADPLSDVGRAAQGVTQEAFRGTWSVNGGYHWINISCERAVVKNVLLAASSTPVTLDAIYTGYRLFSLKMNGVVNKGLGGNREDQQVVSIEPKCSQVLLRSLTDDRFLEVFDDYESGRMKERLEKEFAQIGIEIDQLKVEIENMEEVKQTKAAINKRQSNSRAMVDLVRQPYFYDRTSREEAERYLQQSGVEDGKFLLRKRPTESQSFVLSFCHKRDVIHYHIQHHQDAKYGIEDGPRFTSPIELIDYHRANQGGLLTNLTKPCSRPEGVEPKVCTNGNYKNIKALDFTRLTLENKLGLGNFGSVLKGVYTLTNGTKIEVAVKQLKTDSAEQKSDIEHEAQIMLKLDHPHIVRMIGMCQQPTMMLVMELAINGPLHKYLRKHKEVTIRQILVMLLQVSEGMEYLDSKHFVHRDLAARNVLMVDVNFVKISNFGMSRAMDVGNNYYQAEAAGKWPLKWYAPECIYYYKFTTKGDVWSYGITLWEALTYGGKPYDGLHGQEVIQYLENEERLTCPLHCPESVYSLMRACWEMEPEKRPEFSLVKETLSDIILHFMQ